MNDDQQIRPLWYEPVQSLRVSNWADVPYAAAHIQLWESGLILVSNLDTMATWEKRYEEGGEHVVQ